MSSFKLGAGNDDIVFRLQDDRALGIVLRQMFDAFRHRGGFLLSRDVADVKVEGPGGGLDDQWVLWIPAQTVVLAEFDEHVTDELLDRLHAEV